MGKTTKTLLLTKEPTLLIYLVKIGIILDLSMPVEAKIIVAADLQLYPPWQSFVDMNRTGSAWEQAKHY